MIIMEGIKIKKINEPAGWAHLSPFWICPSRCPIGYNGPVKIRPGSYFYSRRSYE